MSNPNYGVMDLIYPYYAGIILGKKNSPILPEAYGAEYAYPYVHSAVMIYSTKLLLLIRFNSPMAAIKSSDPNTVA